MKVILFYMLSCRYVLQNFIWPLSFQTFYTVILLKILILRREKKRYFPLIDTTMLLDIQGTFVFLLS